MVLLRELNVASDGSELFLLLGMGAWLLASGIGAVLGPPGGRPSPGLLRLALLVYALLLPTSVAACRALPTLLGATPGGDLPPMEQLAAMALGLLPCGMLARTFP